MYATFEKEGITTVFDCGDLTAGWKVYHGQEMELTHFGQDEQIDYVIKSHPRRKGITTFAISGNHDLKEYERGGADPLVQIEHCRDDIVYLGQLSANVKLTEGVTLEMLHPGGTYPYALSYKAQRDINNRQPNQLPDILAYGHYHGAFYMYYRGIHFIQAPTFKNQGLWERRMGLNPVVGGWIVEAAVYGDRIGWFKPQLHTFDRKG
jgi:predicted phosphodiesterase